MNTQPESHPRQDIRKERLLFQIGSGKMARSARHGPVPWPSGLLFTRRLVQPAAAVLKICAAGTDKAAAIPNDDLLLKG